MLELDKKTFKDEVTESSGYVLVDYWAPTCEPCKALMPDVVALSEVYGEKVKFCKLDTSQARRVAIGQQVLGLPTIALYKDGEKIAEVTKDDASKESIEEMIKSNI